MNMVLRQFPRQAVRKSYRLYEVVVMSGTSYIPHLDYAPLKSKMSSRNREFFVNKTGRPVTADLPVRMYCICLMGYCLFCKKPLA